MQDPIASLAAHKIAEFLKQCGINYADNDQIDACIQILAKFARETRLSAGIDSGIPRPDARAPGNRCRGSYRIQENDSKRGAMDYGGLDKAPRKKRKLKRPVPKDLTADDAGDSSLVQKSHVACAPPVSSQDQTEAGPVDQLPNDYAATDLGASQTLNDILPKGSSVHGSGTLGESGDPDASVQGAPDATNHSTSSPTEYHVEYNDPPLTSPQLPSAETKVMETILVDCAKLNYALRQTSTDKKQPSLWDPNALQIRGYVEDIAKRDFTEAVRHISAGNTAVVKGTVQARYSEAIFWDVITKHAEELDPTKLGNAKGPPTDFTVAEKEATRKFLKSTGDSNMTLGHLRGCRLRWRRLSDMRKRGVDKILCYHTSSFNSFCKAYKAGDAEEHVGLVDKVLSWERLYEWYITHLEHRVATSCGGDNSGRLWLKHPFVAERLTISEDLWDSSANPWGSPIEKAQFNSIPKYKSLPDAHPPSTEHSTDADKSMFVTLLPKEGKSALYACPIIAVRKGDSLGIFAGKIRYSDDFDSARGIRGPEQGLWLDYRDLTGTLNLMEVVEPNENANVRLVWEHYHHLEKGEWICSWKVFVRATKVIKAFESIIRAAPSPTQYLLHQSSVQARRGYMTRLAAEVHNKST
ncbi:hypothetical protein ARSEF4850_006883 [Beauveria asiatica]